MTSEIRIAIKLIPYGIRPVRYGQGQWGLLDSPRPSVVSIDLEKIEDLLKGKVNRLIGHNALREGILTALEQFMGRSSKEVQFQVLVNGEIVCFDNLSCSQLRKFALGETQETSRFGPRLTSPGHDLGLRVR
ncbi:MAG: hypothetical protein ISS87_02260 [Candidatus Pacebacteria bacterium]|nr:hypothetical protein [Candidatus Paceibacterota bacterium]